MTGKQQPPSSHVHAKQGMDIKVQVTFQIPDAGATERVMTIVNAETGVRVAKVRSDLQAHKLEWIRRRYDDSEEAEQITVVSLPAAEQDNSVLPPLRFRWLEDDTIQTITWTNDGSDNSGVATGFLSAPSSTEVSSQAAESSTVM